jgi:hypothetical protein
MLGMIEDSTACSWLSSVTHESVAAPSKYSVCFWIEKRQEEGQGNGHGGRSTRRHHDQDEQQHLEDEEADEFTLAKVRTLVHQMTRVPPLVVDSSLFVGDWQLVELYDSNNKSVAFPLVGRPFVLRVTRAPMHGYGSDRLGISIIIGYRMRGTMTFLDQEPNAQNGKTTQHAAKSLLAHHTIHIGMSCSTLMYGPELDALETFVNKTLQKACLLEILQDVFGDQTQSLTIGSKNGRHGRLVFAKGESKESCF